MLRPGVPSAHRAVTFLLVVMRQANILRSSLAAFALVAGCYTVDIAGQSNFNGCPPSTVITAGQNISDFKQRIQRQTAVAPADSVLDVVLTFATKPDQSDRDRISTYHGSNIAITENVASLKAEFLSQDLARYVAEDTGRLIDAVIYDPACRSE